MARPLIALVCLLAFASVSVAGPLDRRQLPAQTIWLVHLDLDAARASTLLAGSPGGLASRPEVTRAIERARQATGMDPAREIRSLTLYGISYAPRQAVLIVRGKVDRPKLEALLAHAAGYRHEQRDGRDLYYWNEKTARAVAAGSSARVGAFVGTDTIVIAAETPVLVTALDVIDGKAASLSESSELGTAPDAGTVLHAAAIGFAEATNLPIQSPILHYCDSVGVSLGERDAVAFFHGKLTTRSAETAIQVKQAMDALRRALTRKAAESAELAQLLPALSLTLTDRTIHLDWEFSPKELARLVESHVSAKAALVQKGSDR